MGDYYLENRGIVYRLKNNRYLSNSDSVDIHEVPKYARNPDNVCVICEECSYEYMRFHPGPVLEGKWVCDFCGIGVTEKRVYKKLEEENERWIKNNLGDDEVDQFCSF